MNFYYKSDIHDTIGYDAETGYGMLRGGETMENMLPPYQLNHYKIRASFTNLLIDSTLDPFIILAPWSYEEFPLIPPSSYGVAEYWAKRSRVQLKVKLDNWLKARSWGRGGRGTVGWSGVQPMDGESNVVGNPSGWCRVVGDCMPGDTNFNYNNVRDISYRNDTITLETFIYELFDKIHGDTLGWFPGPPDSVIFRYTVWGVPDTTVGISENENIQIKNNIDCQSYIDAGKKNLIFEYVYNKDCYLNIFIYNSLGQIIKTEEIKNQTGDFKKRIVFDFSDQPAGSYYIVVRNDSNIGFCNFIYNP